MKLFINIFLLLLFSCSIPTKQEGESKIIKRFSSTFKEAQFSKAASFLVHSDMFNLHLTRGEGSVLDNGVMTPTSANQPFHIASIGKVFTATIILKLFEEGKLNLSDPIDKYLKKESLDKLFLYNGIDYSDKVTITQLLNHTSGINDYFESENKDSNSLLKEIKKNPDKFWTPEELLDFTRVNQKAVGKPADKYFYSDTGYILLGLIIEKVSGKKFEVVLQEKILTPLNMKDTYMHLRSEPLSKPKKPISTMMLSNKDVTTYKSISADWTGGGIISTAEDLLIFQSALVMGKIISQNNYLAMRGRNKFIDGVYYGLGLMTVRFGDMLFLMKGSPELQGHSGLLSTVMFYSAEIDTHIIANLGSTEDIPKVFEMMYWISSIVKDMKKLQK
jgi:D-alanyl-D-alanine carboxypeptidase